MSRLFICILAACSMLLSQSVVAAPLIADLSNYQITMDSTYNGTRIFVFGTRNENGDVVVVVRGPYKDYVVRRKREVAGVWVNAERVRLFGIPAFYAVASNKPLEVLGHVPAYTQLAIGEEYLFGASRGHAAEDFRGAFVAYQQSRGLYRSTVAPITFMGETLFKTVIEFPDNIPPGNYSAEIYLLKEHAVVGTHTLPIEVRKVGLDAFVYDTAHHYPFLYGVTAVLLALFFGWFAGRLFQKI